MCSRNFGLFTIFLSLHLICNAEDPVVQLPEGKIRGHVLKSFNGSEYYSFQEIPYAAPPVGENRFKEPKNPDAWNGVLNTTQNTKICAQNQTWGDLNLTEDCLYLNVYSPQKPGSSDLLPVLFWIHGGGYVTGSGAFAYAQPDWFMDYGIVVVTINYRLGPFGFLNTMDGVISGNLGLKDQRQALRWVNKNIQLFGGNPNEVTIAGESAGAFSVGFQLLSQNADGLFRGAIQESGTSMCRTCYNDNARHFAFQLGNILDKNLNEQNSSAELLGVLQKASTSDILSAGLQLVYDDDSIGFFTGDIVWAPVIENSNDSVDPIVTTLMYDSFINGEYHQVPTLIGFNSEESLLFLNGRNCSLYDTNPSAMAGRKLNIAKENLETVGETLKKIYTSTSFADDFAACVKYTSDATFLNPIVRQAETTSEYTSVYLYQLSYVGQLGAFMFPTGRPIIPGAESVSHAEDLAYLWDYGIRPIAEPDLLNAQRMQTLWSNFVKYLNPTPQPDELLQNVSWLKVNNSNGLIQYLNIDSTLQMRANPRYYKQVNVLFQKYQQPPFITW